jgi:prepilin-type N-terminal cleavage/methylation domain-containing protein
MDSALRTTRREGQSSAFTLVELLVVISLIGVLMFIAVPAFKGFGQSNSIAAAQQQLRDDLGFARLQAIKNRSPVYMVFLQPPYGMTPEVFGGELNRIHGQLLSLPGATEFDRRFRDIALREFTNSFAKQFTGYALYTDGSLGEQPGVKRSRFLTEWRMLPEGTLFPTNGLEVLVPGWAFGPTAPSVVTNLNLRSFPFPIAPERDSPAMMTNIVIKLPAIAFDAQGRLFNFDGAGRAIGNGTTLADRFVAVGSGSVQFGRQVVAKGEPDRFDFTQPADVVETPRRNYTNQIVRVSALTGRTKGIKPPE